MMYITCIRNKEVFSIFRWLLFLAKDHLRAKPFFLNVLIGRAALGSGSLQTIFVSYIPAAVAMAVANLGRGLILSFNSEPALPSLQCVLSPSASCHIP